MEVLNRCEECGTNLIGISVETQNFTGTCLACGSTSYLHHLRIFSQLRDGFGIADAIQVRGSDILLMMKNNHFDHKDHALIAACMAVACQIERRPLPYRDIISIMPNLEMKRIVKEKRNIIRVLNINIWASTSAEYLEVYLDRLGMGGAETVAAATESLENFVNIYHRGIPTSIAAGFAYIFNQISPLRLSAAGCSHVVNLSVPKLTKMYREIHPFLAEILPADYPHRADILLLPF